MSEAISRIDLAAWHRACRCDPYATGTKLRRNRTICESYPGFRFAPSGLQSCQRVGWADLLRNPTPSARTDDGFRFRSTHPTIVTTWYTANPPARSDRPTRRPRSTIVAAGLLHVQPLRQICGLFLCRLCRLGWLLLRDRRLRGGGRLRGCVSCQPQRPQTRGLGAHRDSLGLIFRQSLLAVFGPLQFVKLGFCIILF